MDPISILGGAVIDIDGNGPPGDFPGWLREIVDRALGTNAFHSKPRSASDEAIASLVRVNPHELEEKDCPICFDPYEIKETEVEEEETENPYLHTKQVYDQLISEDKILMEKLNSYGINLESMESRSRFCDPAMFFPTDYTGSHYSRFPQCNLSTLQKVTLEDQFPDYEDQDKIKEDKDDRIKQFKKDGHIAVKMPECDHIFGMSCIVEWLKSNVSCPLCRKEVDAKDESPAIKKETRLNQITRSNFNNRDAALFHIRKHSTDVFNPFKRPFNPSITPVTDSYMPQDWVTPSTQSRVRVRDPEIVVPKRFPFPDPIPLTRAIPISRFHRRTRSQPSTTPQQTPGTASSNASGTRRVNFSPHTTNIDDLHDESSGSESSASSLLNSTVTSPTVESDGNARNNTLSFMQRLHNRLSRNRGNQEEEHRGGPDRTRRNGGNGRRHPYSREPSDD
ncbi:uncharacterized protein J8A68_002519 [[Candida] subhashii]|uniref:RING-type domain-containing protein n=1 Tax=[Candida] subhashii TaxID=561895 RepID=A0A8J5QKT2_9ASCO|nr:uncharacterized protein J8A68_002519 [[Candida] subhashii]KAG7663958.1 hypothetical protein J8A68_002519 [[Candida] subhashii]